MNSISRYTPMSVRLPENGALARDFLHPKQHLPGRAPLEESDYVGYDRHFVFYDVFLDANGDSLRAIGPRLVNLKKALLPITVTVSDLSNQLGESAPLATKITQRYRLARHQFKLPKPYRSATHLHMKMRLANGQLIEQSVHRQQLKPVTLQFSTLQKNNPIEWNIDWLRYCQSIGVQRVLLYDNGSDNVDELESALREVGFEMEVVLIDWPYPYGPRRSHYNNYCQAAQNNHTYQCFGNSEWTGHFDIDEFLTVRPAYSTTNNQTSSPPNNLIPYLNKFPQWIGLLRFDSYLFPNVRDEANIQPSVRDFAYRANTLHKRAYKYIVRSKTLRLAKTHNGNVKFGYWRKAVNPVEAVFYHYMGLTMNWRGNDPRQHIVKFDPEINLEDRTIIDCFTKLDAK